MWNNVTAFDDRDYKRLKAELNWPYEFAPSGLRVQTDCLIQKMNFSLLWKDCLRNGMITLKTRAIIIKAKRLNYRVLMMQVNELRGKIWKTE